MNPKAQSNYQNASTQTTSTSRQSSQYYSDSDGKALIRTFLKLLYVFGILAGLYFAYLNTNPYVIVVRQLVSQTDVDGFGRFLGSIPLVGGIAKGIGASSTWIFGIVLWVVIQLAQCAPIVLFRDKALMRTMLEEHDRAHRIVITEKDDPVAAATKSVYNKLPLGLLRNLGKIRIGAYIVDFIICSIVYPPCEGGFLKFLLYLSTGAFQRLNWGNITLTLTTMFAIELILRLLLGVGALIYFYRKSRA